MLKPLTIGIVAGECSGDRLGASLITALRALVPDVRFVGVAGPDMRAVGCESWFDMEALSVMGLVEVLRHLPRLLNMRRALVRRFTVLQPDIFIGIDAPDFNLSLELALKRRGIRTLHYVSPSVWAWRPQRIVKIAQATDLVLALFPFEQAFYDAHGVPCRFVGHTLADEMPLEPDRAQARRRLGIAAQAHCLALLPGSRQAEIAQLTPPFLQAAQLLRQGYPELVIVVPLVNSARRAQFIRLHNRYAPALPLVLLDQQATVAMQAADATLLASGTATLECLLAKCPMVVGYKLNPITFWLAKRLVKTLYIALPNLLADRPLVVELLQTACAPQPLAEALMPLLNGDNVHLKHCFTALHQQMRCQASQRAAQAVLELVQGCC